MDNRGARLVILLLGDPHLLERRQRRQDRSTDPHRVLALGGSHNLDLHGRRGKRSDFALHAVSNAGVHGGAAREHNVAIEVLADIYVALHDRVVGGLVDTGGFKTNKRGLEEGFGGTEALVANGDDLSVGQLVRLFKGRRLGGGGHLLFVLEGDVAELLLDVTHDFALGRGGVGVATLGEDLGQVVSQIAASQVETDDGVGKRVSLVDGHGVRHTVARVEHDAGGAARGVQRQHGLDGDVEGGRVEGLKHDLGHLLSVALGVERGFGQEHGVLLGGDAQLIVEGVVPVLGSVPDLLHVVPVGDDAVLDGVLEREDTALALRFVAHIRVFLAHADHDALVAGAAHQRGEDGARGVVAGKPGFAHARSVVNDELCYVVLQRLLRCRPLGKDKGFLSTTRVSLSQSERVIAST